MSKVMLEARGLTKYFDVPGGKLHAVDHVDFVIHEGETLGLVGESGCGKSTTGRLLLRLLEPTEGEVWFDGENITTMPLKDFRKYRSQMQIVFQDPYASLNPRMSLSEIIEEPLIINRIHNNAADRAKRVRELMDTVGLAQRLLNVYPHELDGGRRQRIGIARALALKPRFIVQDEPVSALDVSIQAQILNLMDDLQDEFKLTYLFISHDLSVVKHVSDRIVVMYLGVIVEMAESQDLFDRREHPYTQALLSALPVPSVDIETRPILLKGEISSPINPPDACRFAGRCPYKQELCDREEPKLREIHPGHWVACHFAGNLVQTEDIIVGGQVVAAEEGEDIDIQELARQEVAPEEDILTEEAAEVEPEDIIEVEEAKSEETIITK
ncbi:MAG TPA: ATP-binding cassette domain-containing protein [Tissierellia bacterium]|nr:ATP-binding cassette domain-containing protein [Tissierellia bacterium]